MNRLLIIRLCIVALVAVLLLAAWEKLKDANPGMQLIFFLVVGAGGGLFAIKYLIPWLGDSIGEAVFSSGEQVTHDYQMKAVSKIAQGDYDGAIKLYEGILRDKPEDPFPIAEIARIYIDKMNDPVRALDFIQEHLESKEWPVDDAAFLMFRMIDIHVDNLHDYDTAHDLIEEVIANFPNTRHSANAHHKLHEVEQAQFKKITEERLKHASGEAAEHGGSTGG